MYYNRHEDALNITSNTFNITAWRLRLIYGAKAKTIRI